jgi:hypothetical protein
MPNTEPNSQCGKESERNWTEDFEHENGNYQCRCIECKNMFIGHKRRVVCKVCDGKESDFKKKYFTNNFYWVNETNYKKLQEIALEFGCLCHTKKKQIIEWHEGFKCLGFRTYETNDNVTVFQKEPFLMERETATNYNDMLKEYADIQLTAAKSEVERLTAKIEACKVGLENLADPESDVTYYKCKELLTTLNEK